MKINIEKIKKNKTIKELLEFSIINIDKPSGPTSYWVSDFVRKELGLHKTSHFGTLDPAVSGVLPIALNRACRLTGYFLKEDKEYVGIMHLHKDISKEKLKQGIEKFTGKIVQKPPVKSRVKRIEREREIYEFKILDFDKENRDVLFSVKCEAGTYIRKLIDDLGKELGIGAHMLELRRMRAGVLSENDKEYPIVNLYDFNKAVEEYENEKCDETKLRKILIPAEIISKVYSVIQIKNQKQIVDKLLHGSPLFSEFLSRKYKQKNGEKIAVFCDEKFIGIFNVILNGQIFAKPEFVFQPIFL